jgi:hypothetical protein
MNKTVAVVVMACSALAFGQGGNSATEQKLTQMEKDLWEAWKTHNVEPFKKNMNDGIDVGSGGIINAEAMIKEIGSTECTINGYAVDSPTFRWIDKNTALMTYHATQDGTCGTEKLPGAVWASSLWVKKGRDWRAAFHQETPAAEKKE